MTSGEKKSRGDMRLKYGLLKEILQVKVKENYGRVFWVQEYY